MGGTSIENIENTPGMNNTMDGGVAHVKVNSSFKSRRGSFK
jgi:hypothetical protein